MRDVMHGKRGILGARQKPLGRAKVAVHPCQPRRRVGVAVADGDGQVRAPGVPDVHSVVQQRCCTGKLVRMPRAPAYTPHNLNGLQHPLGRRLAVLYVPHLHHAIATAAGQHGGKVGVPLGGQHEAAVCNDAMHRRRLLANVPHLLQHMRGEQPPWPPQPCERRQLTCTLPFSNAAAN